MLRLKEKDRLPKMVAAWWEAEGWLGKDGIYGGA